MICNRKLKRVLQLFGKVNKSLLLEDFFFNNVLCGSSSKCTHIMTVITSAARSKCGQLQHNCLLKLWFIFIETKPFYWGYAIFTLKTRSLPTLSKGWLGAMFPIVKHQCEHCEHLSSTNPEGNCPKSTITAITAHDSNTTPTWIITYWLINRRLVSVFFARLKKNGIGLMASEHFKVP